MKTLKTHRIRKVPGKQFSDGCDRWKVLYGNATLPGTWGKSAAMKIRNELNKGNKVIYVYDRSTPWFTSVRSAYVIRARKRKNSIRYSTINLGHADNCLPSITYAMSVSHFGESIYALVTPSWVGCYDRDLDDDGVEWDIEDGYDR